MQQIPDHNALAAIRQHPNEARSKTRLPGLGVATAFAFLASAGLARTGEAEQPAFEFYGQLNFGIFHVDDGQGNDTYLSDNDNSNSRIGSSTRPNWPMGTG